MAAATRTATALQIAHNVKTWTWEGLDGDDVGSVVKTESYTDLSVQIGANGGQTHGSATTVLQGSNDPAAVSDPSNAVWFTLKDAGETAISVTANGFRQVLETPLYIRPSQSGGTGGDLDVIVKGVQRRV